MKEIKPIDRKRNSGGSTEIGTKEDGVAVGLTKFKDRLIIIKEKSIYELMLADDIDPQRTNINLPSNIQKLIINKGAESELVSRTFLTAETLFKPDYFNSSIDTEKALQLALEILQELTMLEEEINEYLGQEKIVIEEYKKRRQEQVSFAIPSIINLETRCKTLFQKADHIRQILIEIITVFYPKDDLTKQSHFPKLYDVLKNKYGEKDTFTEFINKKALGFMEVIRFLRNGLDHRLDTIKIKNFELQPDSKIISPSIELNHKESKLDRISLSSFLPIVIQNMVFIIESTFAYLADRNVKSNFMMVMEIPEDKRKFRFVKYSFAMQIGDELVFHQ